jgi:hypothetical protein
MTFPALVPSSRVFTPGEYSNTPWRSMGGRQTQSRHSSVITDQRLSLTFVARDEEDKLLIREHYYDRQGTFGTFDLPEEVWSGVDDPEVFTPAGYVWRYAGTPKVDDVSCGIYDIAVDLVMLPDDGPGSIANTQDALIKPPAVRLVFAAQPVSVDIVVPALAAGVVLATQQVSIDIAVPTPAAGVELATQPVSVDIEVPPPAAGVELAAIAPDVLSETP